MTAEELLSDVTSAAGFDVPDSDTRVLRWLNHLIREMAAESQWIMATPDIGPTVADQAAYTLPASIVVVKELRVGADGRPWEREGIRTMWDLQSSEATLNPEKVGVFTQTASDDGTTKQVVLWPVPDTAGLVIEAFAAIYPSDISGSQEPPFPEEFHMPLVHGVIAYGLSFSDEDNANAQYHRGIYDAAKAELRMLGVKRLRSRHARAKIAGYDFA